MLFYFLEPTCSLDNIFKFLSVSLFAGLTPVVNERSSLHELYEFHQACILFFHL